MIPNKAAIIIVTYNRSDATNLAFDSLVKAKNQTPFTVFVVDNKSRDIEREKMKHVFNFLVSSGSLSGQFIENENNSGYSAGNNIGIRLALQDPSITHLCLLNNDTIVSDGWLDTLIAHSENSLVGPVSNSVGNEQIIGTSYRIASFDGYSRDEVRDFADQWKMQHSGHVVSTKMLGFFCALGERKLFEKVGFLDEDFGLGYFEDDDFCLRSLKEGFNLKIVREVFIHHWGSASFTALQDDTKTKLMEKNRLLFESKHKTKWTPLKDSWALSLAHELDWFRKNPSFDPEIAEKIGFWFTQCVRNEAFSLCSRATFVPGGLFRSYFREAVKLRFNHHVRFLPAWAIKFFLWIFEYVVSPHFDRPKVIKTWSLWNTWRKSRTGLDLFLRRIMHKSRNEAILILPIQGYAGRKQRPQHIAENLAKTGSQVFWVDPPLNDSSDWIGSKRIEFTDVPSVDGLTLLKPIGYNFENFYVSGWSTQQAEEFLNQVTQSLRATGLTLNKFTLMVQSPFWTHTVKLFPGATIYECMDSHDDFGSATAEVKALEKTLLDTADAIVVTSSYLKTQLEKNIKPTAPLTIIRNGCDPKHFIRTSDSKMTSKPIKKTVGYFGAVAEWFDEELLLEATRLLPEIHFEVIGNSFRSKLPTLKLPDNLKLLGEKNYQQLPELISHWSATLIPFKLSKLILATNPVKLYEYSAFGLPVISTPIPEVMEAGIPVYIGHDGASFAKAIIQAIDEDSLDKQDTRRVFAQNNSWEMRAEQVRQFINTLQFNEESQAHVTSETCLESSIVLKK